MEKTTTQRGFSLYEFDDSNGEGCTVQKSSSASEPKIWLGITDPNPIIKAQDAKRLEISTSVEWGWVGYPLPKGVEISTRIHLNQEQVAELIPILQKFVDTGEI